MRKPNLLFIGILPPPVFGVPIINQILIKNRFVNERYEISVIRINKKAITPTTRFAPGLILSELVVIFKTFLSLLTTKHSLVYLCIAQTRMGLWRDLVFLWMAQLFKIKTLIHLHGSFFRQFLKMLQMGYKITSSILNDVSGVISGRSSD
jgi:hypothetical protein